MAATGRAHAAGNGENAHRWARELRALVDLEDDAGRPLVITVEEPLTPHGQRLADSLGVLVEVKPVTVVDVQAATESRDCPQPGCPFEAEAGRTHCRHHRRLGEPLVLASRRLEAPAAEVREPEPQPRVEWTRESIIAAVQQHAGDHDGCPPTANEWALIGAGRPNRLTVVRVFGTWADAVEAAGFPRPTRGVSPSSLKKRATPALEERAADVVGVVAAARSSSTESSTTSEERGTRRTVGAGRGPRSSDAEVDEALPIPEIDDALSVASMSTGELVACGQIMQTVGVAVVDLTKPERVRVARFIAALLEDVG